MNELKESADIACFCSYVAAKAHCWVQASKVAFMLLSGAKGIAVQP
jgi:hypothetical protein